MKTLETSLKQMINSKAGKHSELLSLNLPKAKVRTFKGDKVVKVKTREHTHIQHE